ncbi:MAG: hypothetical protein ABI579_04255 [Candidatus Sumerlaeota bacterium]
MKIRTREELAEVRRYCEETATRSSWVAAAVGGIPILDIAVDAAVIANRIRFISAAFGLGADDFTKMRGEEAKLVFAVVAEVGNEFIGKYITRALLKRVVRQVGLRVASGYGARLIPVLGYLISGMISYAAARAILRMHINDCEQVVLRTLEGRKPRTREIVQKPRRRAITHTPLLEQ